MVLNQRASGAEREWGNVDAGAAIAAVVSSHSVMRGGSSADRSN